MAAWLAGAVTGAVVSKTTCAVSPAIDGNRAFKMSWACWEGVSPAVNLFSKRRAGRADSPRWRDHQHQSQARSTRRRWS